MLEIVMELYFPTELPQQLAFISAAVVALSGLLALLLPASALRLGGLTTGDFTSEGFAAARSSGGLNLGLGLTALALAQDFTYLMLGVALLLAAGGRILSLFMDRGWTARNGVMLAVQLLLAALPLGYVRSEEHTSELQSLMRSSYAVF